MIQYISALNQCLRGSMHEPCLALLINFTTGKYQASNYTPDMQQQYDFQDIARQIKPDCNYFTCLL